MQPTIVTPNQLQPGDRIDIAGGHGVIRIVQCVDDHPDKWFVHYSYEIAPATHDYLVVSKRPDCALTLRRYS